MGEWVWWEQRKLDGGRINWRDDDVEDLGFFGANRETGNSIQPCLGSLCLTILTLPPDPPSPMTL